LSEWCINDEEGFDSLDSYVVELAEGVDVGVVGVVDYCNDSPMVTMTT